MALAGSDDQRVGLFGRCQRSAVPADDDEAVPGQLQLEVAAVRRVDHAPPLGRTTLHDQARALAAVDEDDVAVAPEGDVLGIWIESDAGVAVEVDVVEDEHPLDIYLGLVRRAHQQRPVEAELHLLVGVDVRVIPVQSGVTHHEAVLEALARVGRAAVCRVAIHVGWQPQAMPVHGGGSLRHAIGEPDDQRVAHVGDDMRPRDRRGGSGPSGIAVCHHASGLAIAAVVDLGLDGLALHLYDTRVRVQVERGLECGEQRAGRRGSRDGLDAAGEDQRERGDDPHCRDCARHRW